MGIRASVPTPAVAVNTANLGVLRRFIIYYASLVPCLLEYLDNMRAADDHQFLEMLTDPFVVCKSFIWNS
jgi:hypothetical protein